MTEDFKAKWAYNARETLKYFVFATISGRLFTLKEFKCLVSAYFGGKKKTHFGMEILSCRSSVWEKVGKLCFSSLQTDLLSTFTFKMIILYNIHF